jgi:hypothetical protein
MRLAGLLFMTFCVYPLTSMHIFPKVRRTLWGVRINTLELRARLPTIFHAAGREAGRLSIEQPTMFDFVINLAASKALRLSVPQTLLATDRTLVVVDGPSRPAGKSQLRSLLGAEPTLGGSA